MTAWQLEDLGPGAVLAHARADGRAVHLLHVRLHLRDCMEWNMLTGLPVRVREDVSFGGWF